MKPYKTTIDIIAAFMSTIWSANCFANNEPGAGIAFAILVIIEMSIINFKFKTNEIISANKK